MLKINKPLVFFDIESTGLDITKDKEAGGIVVDKSMKRLRYNKNREYINSEFFVIGDQGFDWNEIIKSITS